MAIKTWHKGVAVILGAAGAWLAAAALPARADADVNAKFPVKISIFAAKDNAHSRRGPEWRRRRDDDRRRGRHHHEEWKRRRGDGRRRDEHRRWDDRRENWNRNKWRDRERWNRRR